jgi:PTH1 family peptidyl-tRNA hydrolase
VFQRIKVGVGEKPKEYDLADYVLGHFSKAEKEIMLDGYDNAIEAVRMIVQDDIDAAMNQFNKKVVKE